MLLTVTWPTKRPSTSITKGRPAPAWPGGAGAPSDDLVRRRARRGRPGGTVASHGRSQSGCAARTACQLVGVGPAQRADRPRPATRSRAGHPGAVPDRPVSGRSRRPARPRGGRRGSRTARPSFTPPREPGRLTTRQSPAIPARPRDSIAVGTPLADAVRRGSPRRCRAPRGRAAARSPPGCGRSGVSPVPPVVSTSRAPAATAARDRLAHRVAVGHDDGVAAPRSPARAAQPTISGPVSSAYDPGRGAVGRDDAPPPGRLIACHVPRAGRRVLLSTRMSVMVAALSTALTMSTTVSAATDDGGQRLHLDAGAVGGADRRGDVDRRRRRPPGRRSRRRSRAGGTAGSASGVRLARHDPGDAGDRQRVALGHALAAQQLDDRRRRRAPGRWRPPCGP